MQQSKCKMKMTISAKYKNPTELLISFIGNVHAADNNSFVEKCILENSIGAS